MADLVLKDEILEKLRKDPELFGKVATCLDTTVGYCLQLINRKDLKLTQASVLRIIREHTGITEDSELLTELEAA